MVVTPNESVEKGLFKKYWTLWWPTTEVFNGFTISKKVSAYKNLISIKYDLLFLQLPLSFKSVVTD
ncbi:MAG: hypothetical protein A2Y66_00925 [Nitrospirae bacterium RBG_13_41_22]|nr:MAG: hypothetical protein A2Y66_00925 [Nitrospirae bacterium RBG_13_41_22]